MSRWFRVHDDLVDDPKVQLLAGDIVKALLNLWCLASQNDGRLPPMKDMAFKLRMKPQQIASIIAQLSVAGLIDREGDEYKPHNWNKRQYKSDTDKTAAERSKRYRAKQRDGNAPVTRDDASDANACRERPDTDTDTETEKKETRVTALDDWPSDFREQFWNDYPHKIGKADAITKLERVRKRGVSWVVLMDGLRRYTASKPVDRPWCNPATWLNQARWEDQPAGSAVKTISETDIDWDAVLTSYKKFGAWSKYAGPDLDSPECRAPREMLAKYGLLRSDLGHAAPAIPRLQTVQSNA